MNSVGASLRGRPFARIRGAHRGRPYSFPRLGHNPPFILVCLSSCSRAKVYDPFEVSFCSQRVLRINYLDILEHWVVDKPANRFIQLRQQCF